MGQTLSAAAVKTLAPDESVIESALFNSLQSAAVQVEVLVGAWLLTGRAKTPAWVAAFGLFSVFAVVSLSSALAGHSDCGCFGRIKVNPWLTTALNASCIALLSSASPGGTLKSYFLPGVAVLALATLTAVVGLWWTSPSGVRWAAEIRGETFALSPRYCDLGASRPGQTVVGRVTVSNLTGREFRIVGGSTSCSCTTARGLPVTLPAKQSAEIEIDVVVSGTPGRYGHTYELFTDSPAQPKLTGIVTGAVTTVTPD